MSKDSNILTEGITRRTFLKRSLGAGVFVLAAGSLGAALASATGCVKKASADIIVSSTVDFQHAHNITIPGADIDSASSDKTYTSDGPTHSHAITLKKADFQAIKGGQTVTVTSTATGTTPHTHTWVIKKAPVPAGGSRY